MRKYWNHDPLVLTVPNINLKIAESILLINGDKKLQGTANLWLSMAQYPKPFSSLYHIIPALYAFWNAMKGGSDITTKFMDECILCIPKMYLNCGTVALTHLIMPLADTHLSQVFTSKEDLNFYPSLYHYCNAVTHRQMFHVSLLSFFNVFKKEIKKIEDNINTHEFP